VSLSTLNGLKLQELISAPFVDGARVCEGLILFGVTTAREERARYQEDLRAHAEALEEAQAERALLRAQLSEARAGLEGCAGLLLDEGRALVASRAHHLPPLSRGARAERLLWAAGRGGDVEGLLMWVKRCEHGDELSEMLRALLALAPERWPLVASLSDRVGVGDDLRAELARRSGAPLGSLEKGAGGEQLRLLAERAEAAALSDDLAYIQLMFAQRLEARGAPADALARYKRLLGSVALQRDALEGLTRLYCAQSARVSSKMIEQMLSIFLGGSVAMGRALFTLSERSEVKRAQISRRLSKATPRPFEPRDLPEAVVDACEESELKALRGAPSAAILSVLHLICASALRARPTEPSERAALQGLILALAERLSAPAPGARARRRDAAAARALCELAEALAREP